MNLGSNARVEVYLADGAVLEFFAASVDVDVEMETLEHSSFGQRPDMSVVIGQRISLKADCGEMEMRLPDGVTPSPQLACFAAAGVRLIRFRNGEA